MEKPTTGAKFRALLATGRFANLPTVWSNVLVAFWIASLIHGYFDGGKTLQTTGILLLLCASFTASLIYLGGCLLGDAVDVEFDRRNRPGRPLPQGILSPGAVKLLAFALLAIALLVIFSSTLVSFVGAVYIHEEVPFSELIRMLANSSTLQALQIHEMIVGCVLIVSVISYAYFHKRIGKTAVFLMAACRSLLIIYAASTAFKSFFANLKPSSSSSMHVFFDWLDSWLLLLASTVGIYTLLLSWVASTESEEGLFKKRQMLCLLFVAIPSLVFVFHPLVINSPTVSYDMWGLRNGSPAGESLHWRAFYVTLAAFVMWLIFTLNALRSSKPLFVSRALAGFCLLDACFVAAFAPGIAAICIVFFALALLLQRVTPAT